LFELFAQCNGEKASAESPTALKKLNFENQTSAPTRPKNE